MPTWDRHSSLAEYIEANLLVGDPVVRVPPRNSKAYKEFQAMRRRLTLDTEEHCRDIVESKNCPGLDMVLDRRYVTFTQYRGVQYPAFIKYYLALDVAFIVDGSSFTQFKRNAPETIRAALWWLIRHPNSHIYRTDHPHEAAQ